MTVIAFRSPVLKPLVRHDVAVVPGDRSVFRVTQRFGDPDFYWRNIDPAKAALGHRATDIGDFGCGSPLVSMAIGRVTHHVDNATAFGAPNNAICSRLDVGPGTGLVIDYWHCATHLVANGTMVQPGTPVATVGNTGLGQVCHCHITFTLNGKLIDPEPHMFGAPLTIGEDTSIMLNKADVTGLHGLTVITKAGARVRETPSLTGRVIHTFPAGIELIVSAVVTGQFLALGDLSGNKWYGSWVEEHDKTLLGFAHDSTVTLKPAPIAPPPTGFTQAQVDAARAEGTSIGFARAKTKAAAAVAAIEP